MTMREAMHKGGLIMSEKLRVDGMTVDSSGMYSGADVLRLIKTSFENGKRKGKLEAHNAYIRGYEKGYSDGKEAVVKFMEELRNIVNKMEVE